MEQFALALVYPRSIAWFIRPDEWKRFEEIVKYNCAMVGGYFNVFIPLKDDGTLTEQYQRFLIDYDPDLIILAPGMQSNDLNIPHTHLHPFAIIPYKNVSQVALLDAWGGGSGLNVTLGAEIAFNKKNFPMLSFVAVADDEYPDTSRLALVACGDVEPREPMWHVMDEDVSFSATGHREIFLMKLLKSELNQVEQTSAYVDEEGGIIPAPDRHQLTNIISKESQFPLSDGVKILETCCRLQEHFDIYSSFVGLTANYKKGGTPPRIPTPRLARGEMPSLVILVSDSLNIEESILFWNLRASGFFVSWLSFSEIEKEIDPIITWLESDYGGGFYSMVTGGLNIVFASPKEDHAHLEILFKTLLEKKQKELPRWYILSYEELIFYDYMRPCITQERVSIAEFMGKYTCIPKLPSSYSSGVYTVELRWNGLMLPQNDAIVRNLISSVRLEGLIPFYRKGRRIVENAMEMPKFRLTSRRYLEAQISTDEPITFGKPSANKVIETLFKTAGFSRIELSSTARYHMIFLERIGGIEKVQQYLAMSPHRELLELLSDNSDKRKAGWILTNPSKRRALNHLQLWEVLGKVIPHETKTYVNSISDIFPEEALKLLEMGILERGFLLHCAFCSYSSWYPTEHVGQTFQCVRCFQNQIYKSNPLWLYKLPEVIFQGFEDNMQVPLLALHYLERRSGKCFESVPDSNVHWVENSTEYYGNTDILCLCDGNFYIGEAKSSDEIERDQFSFYEKIARHVAIDGIVFATSKPQWKRATLQRIEELKTWFDGEVLILTGQDLYPSSSAT